MTINESRMEETPQEAWRCIQNDERLYIDALKCATPTELKRLFYSRRHEYPGVNPRYVEWVALFDEIQAEIAELAQLDKI